MKRGCTPLIKERILRLSWLRHPVARRTQNLFSSLGRREQDIKHARNGRQQTNGSAETHADRDLLFSVLNASTTRRDAKAYLSRFTSPRTQAKNSSKIVHAPLHIAIVQIREADSLDDATVTGVGQTLSHLAHLGLHSIVVLDDEPAVSGKNPTRNARTASVEADRYVSALLDIPGTKARRLGYILGIKEDNEDHSFSAPASGTVRVQYTDILLETLRRGSIPVIPSIAYLTGSQRAVRVNSDEVVPALIGTLTGLLSSAEDRKRSAEVCKDIAEDTMTCYVEKIIVLDPLGGLPSNDRPDKAHIFVNLEQEYNDIRRALGRDIEIKDESGLPLTPQNREAPLTVFGSSNPLSKFAETEVLNSTEPTGKTKLALSFEKLPADRQRSNLDVIQKCLSLLPSSSSALLTTPTEAATFPTLNDVSPNLGVVTRRPRNPLIFNLLTDKPVISSSLPAARATFSNEQRVTPASFFKKGMAVTMIPDPRLESWTPPAINGQSMSLDDPRIDFARLLNLIEDSFNRPLDVQHYVDRVRNKMAGIIVAGEYEGGALLTWELPQGVPDDGSEESRRRMVPYLDKFAVLKRSQGAGGVADIVFSAMVRTCFPNGVCWRSRKNNPVNKWYFERSLGSWKLPGTEWSMFWTTPDLVADRQRFSDYESVCRNIRPSWADKKHILD